MNTRYVVAGVLAAVMLLGCQNLNIGRFSITHVEVKDTTMSKEVSSEWDVQLYGAPATAAASALPAPAEAPRRTASLPTNPKISGTTMLCPMFRAPAFPPPPDLPLKELEEIGNNHAKIDVLQRKHIEELRSYAQRTRDTMVRAYAQYLRECQAFGRKR